MSNLLLKALKSIKPKSVYYIKFTGETKTVGGVKKLEYDYPILISQASVQPVSTYLVQQLGLDTQKQYRRIFVPTNALALDEQNSSDKFEFDGGKWSIWESKIWETYDGWNNVIVVKDKN